ncbi:MAG: hypothetical protein H6710_09305 [Myxococcales bacterium]|nr:hypothetical protein [Myxococcales bacterium]MCB9700737.1 hypothetical protein [Myxococcales bacterium]
MRRLAAPLALLGLVAACTPGGDELSQTRAELAQARAELGQTRAELAQAHQQLAAAEEALTSIRHEVSALQERIASEAAKPPAIDTGEGAGGAAAGGEGEGGKTLEEAAAEAIRCDEEGRCAITRAFVDRALAQPEFLARQARVVPALRDGQPSGFKLYAIRPGSLPKLLGFQNGDLVDGVNEHSLNDVEQAMEAYTALRGADLLKIRGSRKGQPFVLEVSIEGSKP